MNTRHCKIHFSSILLASCILALVIAPYVSAQAAPKDSNAASDAEAVGVLEWFPFKDKKQSLRCNVSHIGDGVVLTAGHCFLGANDCNNATVTWAQTSSKTRAVISRCTKILEIRADDSRYAGENLDFALFRVDKYPKAQLEPETNQQNSVGSALTMMTLPQFSNGRLAKVEVITPCQILNVTALAVFKRLPSQNSFVHNCDLSTSANGAPLLDAETGRLIGMHQANGSLPSWGNTRSQEQTPFHVGKFIAGTRLADATRALKQNASLEMNILQEIHIGQFAAEAFPTGFPGNIEFIAARLQPQSSQRIVTFTARTGTETQLDMIDGNGMRYAYAGTNSFTQSNARIRLKLPVTFLVKTAKNSATVSAHIENIQLD